MATKSPKTLTKVHKRQKDYIEKLEKAKRNTGCFEEMIDQGGEENEQQKNENGEGDVLVDYLNSNYELLSQVNQKVNDYLTMKHELRMTAISGKLSVQSLKSPSKD